MCLCSIGIIVVRARRRILIFCSSFCILVFFLFIIVDQRSVKDSAAKDDLIVVRVINANDGCSDTAVKQKEMLESASAAKEIASIDLTHRTTTESPSLSDCSAPPSSSDSKLG